VSWIDGGPTSLDNLVLQCKPDHRAVHRGEYIIKIINGIVHVTRPTWAETSPTRNQPPTGNPTPNTAPDADGPAGSAEAARSAGSAASPGADGSAGAAGSSGVAESTGSAEAAGSPRTTRSAGSDGSTESPGVWGDPPDPGDDHGERLDGRSLEDARAWPWMNDPKPLTREAAIKLAPWGDNEEDNTPPAPREPTPPPDSVSPWGDDHDEPRSARGDEKVAAARVSPWGEDQDEPG
jgi:hypothetical protein